MNGQAQIVWVANSDAPWTVKETATSTHIPAVIIDQGLGWVPSIGDAVVALFVKSVYYIVGPVIPAVGGGG